MTVGNGPLVANEVLGVVCQVRDAALHVLLWQRGRPPAARTWSLPVGPLEPSETLEDAIGRHLAAKVDVHDVAHLEQLGTWSGVRRVPARRVVATAYLGLVRAGLDPRTPPDTRWYRTDRLPTTAFDHGEVIDQAVGRLSAKLSYTNIGFALARRTFTMAELRQVYRAALGHDVSVTNLQRVLLRRGVLEPTGERSLPGAAGGRPAARYRFSHDRLQVTDAFAVLRPRPADPPPVARGPL